MFVFYRKLEYVGRLMDVNLLYFSVNDHVQGDTMLNTDATSKSDYQK